MSNFLRQLAISILAATTLISSYPSSAFSLKGEDRKVIANSINESELKAMVEKADDLRAKGKYNEAAVIWRQLLSIFEIHLGPDHPYVAASLSNLGSLYHNQRMYAIAEPVFRRSLSIREKTFGEVHSDVALTLGNLADVLKEQGRYSEAEPLYIRSLSVYEKVFGGNHPDVALSLNNLAHLYQMQGRLQEAEPLYRRSLILYEKALGKADPTVAVSLNNLANLIREQGKPEEAEPLIRRSLAIHEKVSGADHPNLAMSINNLALILQQQGKLREPEQLIRRSLAIYEKAFGADHPAVATSLDNLGVLLKVQGQFAAAESLYRRSLAIREKALGRDHLDTALSLNNLADLWQEQGLSFDAQSLYLHSLSIRRKLLGADHPDVAVSLNNLANIYSQQGLASVAEDLMRRSLIIKEKSFGQNHPSFALSLNNLGRLLQRKGELVEAESLYRRSLGIYEKIFGGRHPSVALPLSNLAHLLQEKGQLAEAQIMLGRSLAIREKYLPADHPEITLILSNLAVLFSIQGKYGNAISVLSSATKLDTSWLLRELPFLPEQLRATQLRQLGDAWEWSFGWIDHHPSAVSLALETRLNRHGLLPEIERRQALLLNAPGIDRSKVDLLQALTRQLASVSLSADRRSAVRDQRDKLQAEIYREIPDLQLKPVSTSSVAHALPADGALVEFQRYQHFDARKPSNQRFGPAQYVALVLKPNSSISAVPLGPASAIDATVHKALRATAEGLSDADVIWSQLSRQVFNPLLPHLTGSRQWFLSPDGELNRVPFAALPSPQQPDTPLAKSVQLRLLTTGRELLRLKETGQPAARALVVANPNYDRSTAKQKPATQPVEALPPAQRRSAELDSNQWKQLPASEREGQMVATLLGTGLITGSAATTTALQLQMGPRVLHVATHGFFVAENDAKSTEGLKVIQETSPLISTLRQEDPQLRSGLVFAGANQPDLDPNDDGYLTAAEAVNLNLKGTELVVLSACSTGQGEVRTGEGVYGLQRSLTVAGARSTLLSLWKVDDAATAEFMGRFYQRLKAGEGRSDALASVQEEFRSGKVQSPNGSNWKEPYYWAAWQLVGDWQPIKGL